MRFVGLLFVVFAAVATTSFVIGFCQGLTQSLIEWRQKRREKYFRKLLDDAFENGDSEK